MINKKKSTIYIVLLFILILLIIILAFIFKTDTEYLYNLILKKNSHINNSIIRQRWVDLTNIMYKYGFFIETGINTIPNKATDIYNYFSENNKQYEIKNIAEIGFNAGHSCVFFLELFPNSQITIFDICENKYTEKCFDFLNTIYPGRLKLIKGDSTKTVPKFGKNIYDLVHIDGGHHFDIPIKDLNNTYNYLLKNNSIVIFDDTTYEHSIFLNIGLSHCNKIFNNFIKDKNMKILKVCNGATICNLNQKLSHGNTTHLSSIISAAK